MMAGNGQSGDVQQNESDALLDTQTIDELVAICTGHEAVRSFAETITALYVQTTRINGAALDEALAADDLTEVAFVAHRLAGAAANVGGLTLSRNAHALQQAARDGDKSACLGILVDVRRGLEQTVEALQAWSATVVTTSNLEQG